MEHDEIMVIINTYHDYLGKMVNALRHFCEDLEECNYKELSPVIVAVIDGLGWLEEASMNFVQLGYMKLEQYQCFIGLVKIFKEALENQDYILLHDFLEYDFIPFLQEIFSNPWSLELR